MARSIHLTTHQSLYRHCAVHQPDAGVGNLAGGGGVGQGGVLVAAEFQDGVVHLIKSNYRQLFLFIDENLCIFAPTKKDKDVRHITYR